MILLFSATCWPNKARTCPIAKAGRWGWCPSDSHQGGDVLGSCTTASSFKDEKTLIKLEKTPPLTVHNQYLLIHYCHLTIDATWRWNAFPGCFEDCLETLKLQRLQTSISRRCSYNNHDIINQSNIHQLKQIITKYQCITLPETNTSHPKALLKMMFLFPFDGICITFPGGYILCFWHAKNHHHTVLSAKYATSGHPLRNCLGGNLGLDSCGHCSKSAAPSTVGGVDVAGCQPSNDSQPSYAV